MSIIVEGGRGGKGAKEVNSGGAKGLGPHLFQRHKETPLRIDALQEEIKAYMNKESAARVFGDKYEVTKSMTSQERLDMKKVKEILQKNNLLDGLIKIIESETIRYKERKADTD